MSGHRLTRARGMFREPDKNWKQPKGPSAFEHIFFLIVAYPDSGILLENKKE